MGDTGDELLEPKALFKNFFSLLDFRDVFGDDDPDRLALQKDRNGYAFGNDPGAVSPYELYFGRGIILPFLNSLNSFSDQRL